MLPEVRRLAQLHGLLTIKVSAATRSGKGIREVCELIALLFRLVQGTYAKPEKTLAIIVGQDTCQCIKSGRLINLHPVAPMHSFANKSGISVT